MKAQELRLGNRLSYGDFEIIVQSIEKDNIQAELLGANSVPQAIHFTVKGTPANFEGIPLTDDLMAKYQFTLFPWGWVRKSTTDFGVRINLKTSNLKTYHYDVSGNPPVKLRYLHELQNLYYTLTGEEL